MIINLRINIYEWKQCSPLVLHRYVDNKKWFPFNEMLKRNYFQTKYQKQCIWIFFYIFGPWQRHVKLTLTPRASHMSWSCMSDLFIFDKKMSVSSKIVQRAPVMVETISFKIVKYSSCLLIWYNANEKWEKCLISISYIEKKTKS